MVDEVNPQEDTGMLEDLREGFIELVRQSPPAQLVRLIRESEKEDEDGEVPDEAEQVGLLDRLRSRIQVTDSSKDWDID